MSFPERWNSARYACSGRVLAVGLSPASLRLRIHSNQHRASQPSGLSADYERTSALRRDLEQLSSDAGAKLLRALGVNGHEAKLRTASDEFNGHCLALTLLGSYLADTYNGDVSRRGEVSARLAQRRTTWSPCPKSHGIVPSVAWSGSFPEGLCAKNCTLFFLTGFATFLRRIVRQRLLSAADTESGKKGT